MRIRFLAILAIPLFLLALPACSVEEETTATPDSATIAADAEEAECICGTTRGDLIGCPHPRCDAGKNNPDNDDCVCGSLTAGDDE